MNRSEHWRSVLARLAIMAGFLILLMTAIAAQTQTFTLLHTFTGGGDGGTPQAGLTVDRAGNLYGTTSAGGAGYGTVFKLSRAGTGWMLTTLYAFQSGDDGAVPLARVVFGPDGTLYGTTSGGTYTYGTVFNLRPPAAACHSAQCPWTETVLYRFNNESDGVIPGFGAVIFDSAGNIYGTTEGGGGASCNLSYCGVVYELTPSDGNWTESVLYKFTGGADGQYPLSGVTFDRFGNLFGTNVQGGMQGNGVIYELIPSASGWTERTLHTFGGSGDGYQAFGGVIIDGHRNIYGATYGGGTQGGGTVYELQSTGGSWSYSILYNFVGFAGPQDVLTMDAAGNFYDTTSEDGVHNVGNVFKLTPGTGGWTYTDLYDFYDGGIIPIGGVVLDTNGNIYGTTALGGNDNGGVAWELTP